ncbi:complex I NDUFA9 subunit family protein [Novosphingobium sp. SG720]|uniref:complex I NDUFA9 subunit family protein n=1 Tax=Novosphingobium sp. SG720 TaxID=2586998 RepID=UPI001447139B|nr:complex I NDUFA9 subunit family protein [Novosphingobium sp. SG720]NKJ40687.1 NADH dehydrogenase [Novosphingobium sp. SG720]
MSNANPGKAGGRDLADKLVVLVGGSGFFGSHLAQELLARGARLRVCSRHVERGYAIKALGNLGQVQFLRVNVQNERSLAAAFLGADAVVNLVGAFKGDLDAVQGRGAGRVAALAKAAGAQAFVHVSAIGADRTSNVGYARTKAEGEVAVAEAFPGAVVVRPSILFGQDDTFLNLFAKVISQFPVVPVFGPDARLQPLFVDDAACAVATILGDFASHAGKTFELAGPEVLTMLEINQRIAAAQGRKPVLVPVGDAAAGLFASLPGTPLSRDQLALLKAGSVAGGTLPGLADLGLRARPLGLLLDRWMLRYRKAGRFGVKSLG